MHPIYSNANPIHFMYFLLVDMAPFHHYGIMNALMLFIPNL